MYLLQFATWTFKRKCCSKSKKKKKAYCLGKKQCVWWIYCMFGYCVKNCLLDHVGPPCTWRKQIRKMDWPAVSLGVLLSSSGTLSADAQLQWVKSLWGDFLPALMQSLQSKCSWNFHCSKSVTLRTNGEQTRQNNSSCYFSCKFTHIWCMQLSTIASKFPKALWCKIPKSEMMCFVM